MLMRRLQSYMESAQPTCRAACVNHEAGRFSWSNESHDCMFDEDTNNKKMIVLRKLTSFISLPFFFLLSIFTFFQIQSICYYYLMNEHIKMKGFKRIATVVKHSFHTFRQNFVYLQVSWHLSLLTQSSTEFVLVLCLDTLAVGMMAWRGDWQNFCDLEFCIIGTQFEGWLFRTVFVSRCLAPWIEKGGVTNSKLSNKSHMSPQERLEGHSCGQNYITVGKKL